MSEPYYSDDLVTLYHGDCREVAEWPPAYTRWLGEQVADHLRGVAA